MQDEVNEKTVALSIKAAKLTAAVLQAAIKKLLAEGKKQLDKQMLPPKGKQSLRQLMKHSTGVSNIEITDENIKAFAATAKKYGIDFALKKDGAGTMSNVNLKKLIIPNIPYLLFVYLFDKVAQAARLAPGADFSAKLLHIGDGFTAAFSSLAPSFDPVDMLVGIAGAVVLRLIVYFKGKNAKKYRKGTEYGSARWGGAEDIKPYVDPVFENNVLLTQTERLTMSSRPKQPKYARNKNILVIGGSGSGKTRFFVKPNLMQMHSSYVVTDPKGLVFRGRRNPHKTKENLRVCRRWHYDRTSNRNHRIVRAFEP